MNFVNAALATLLILLTAVEAQTQGTPGQAQAYLQTPHEINLEIGENLYVLRVVVSLRCTAGFEGPAPLQVVVSAGALGPDDGNGSAWIFTPASWNFTWHENEAGNYSIDEEFTVTVDAEGYGGRGYFGEFTMNTLAVRNDSTTVCTSTGYTIPTRGGHAHISVGPRPVAAPSNDSPSTAFTATIICLIGLAAMRRRA